MTTIRLTGFAGANQLIDPLQLPDAVGTAAVDVRPGSQALRGWQQPSTLSLAANTVVTGATSIYRFGRDVASDTLYWVTTTQDADFVRSLVPGDTSERTYYTDGVKPKWFDNVFGFGAVPYPNSPRTLGVPAPTTAPTLVPTGGSATTKESRVYVWTWVTDKGEESAPSPACAASALTPTDATWTVTFNESVPTYSGVINARRLYRSAVAANGQTTLLFVAEFANVSNGYQYADTKAATALGGVLATTYWTPPPDTLTGLTALWNGMLAGFTDKTLWICEQMVPYAWPSKYKRVVQDKIVGLGVWQQNLLVLTNGTPYLLTGSDPASTSLQPIDSSYACVSKRSVVDVPGGVVWASTDGLAYFGTKGSGLLTTNVFTPEQWRAFTPASMKSAVWGRFLLVTWNNGSTGTLVFDLDAQEGGRFSSYFTTSVVFDGQFNDPLTGALFLLNSTARTISKWNAGGSALAPSFTSKLFRQARPTNFGWLQVRADTYPVTVSITADGRSVVSNLSVTHGGGVRLPAGFKARDWQITVSGQAVQELLLTTSMDELQKIV